MTLKQQAPMWLTTFAIFIVGLTAGPCLAGSGLKIGVGGATVSGQRVKRARFVENGASVVYTEGEVLHKIPMSSGVAQAISSGEIYDYALSSDTGTLVYALGTHNNDQSMYSVALSTGIQTDMNLTIWNYEPHRIVLVPDGSGLVRNYGGQLLFHPSSGAEERLLAEGLAPLASDIQVTPDSSHVIYQNHFGDKITRLFPLSGGPPSEFPLTDGRSALFGMFTPDGTYMIDTGMNIYAFDGSLATWQPVEAEFLGLESITPDGSRILYSLNRSYDHSSGMRLSRNLFSVPIDGTEAGVNVIPTDRIGTYVRNFDITPDSQSVVVGAGDSAEMKSLYLVSLLGENLSRLTSSIASGTELVYAGMTTDEHVIYQAKISGDTEQRLYRTSLADKSTDPIPTPGLTLQANATLTPDKKILLFAGTDSQGLQNVYAMPATGGPAVPVTEPFSDDYACEALGDMQFSPDGSRGIFTILFNDYHQYKQYHVFGIPLTMVDVGDAIHGSITGGVGFIGGIDYSFDQVDAAGMFRAEFFRTALAEFAPDLAAVIDFLLTGETAQIWDMGFDGDFTGPVTLTFTYDETLIGPGVTEATLGIFHQLGDGTFELLPVLNRDLDNNSITVTTDSFSNFVLGAVPEPTSAIIIMTLGSALAMRRGDLF